MKKYIVISFICAILAMIFGVFYREFTKAMDFTGVTVLGKIHPHLFILGMLFFLVLAVVDRCFTIHEEKPFKYFLIIYLCGLGVTVLMMLVRGILEVNGASLSSGVDGMISGIAGLGHILLGTGIILFFVCLIKKLKKNDEIK